ncbi:MAG: DUF2189 domain-containing protein [Sphingomonadaceae bacterium]
MSTHASAHGNPSQAEDLPEQDPAPAFIPEGWTPPPAIRNLHPGDVFDCLHRGVRDFRASFWYGLFFAAFYVVGGLGLVALLLFIREYELIFPAIAGFLLLGPATAVGLYEISRRLEAGEPLERAAILTSFRRHGGTQLLLFGGVLIFLMIVWMRTAGWVYALTFPVAPASFGEFLARVFSADARPLWIWGNLAGAVLAGTAFTVSVTAIPHLLDRDVDFMTALATSVKAVVRNPVTMLFFALIIGVMVGGSIATFFLGFFVTLPVIGHTTWHLYRRTILHRDSEPQGLKAP